MRSLIFSSSRGSITRLIKVLNPDLKPQVIAEFEHHTVVEALEALFLPYRRPRAADCHVIHVVQSLASIYTNDAGTTATNTYLSGLRDLAKLSGRQFEDILREELARISESVKYENSPEFDDEPVETETPLTQIGAQIVCSILVSAPEELSQAFHKPQTTVEVRIFLSKRRKNMDSTPEVQCVVVKHTVKSSEIASQIQSPCKLKSFSGRLPQPKFEVNYDTWCSSVEFCLNDPSISASQMVRKIRERLLPPAANIVKSLGPQASPREYLNLLDSAYTTVEDGDELFVQFLNNNQNAGEKASDYLQRLHTAMSCVVKRGGIPACDSDKQLLKQFCCGCWNNTLITSLQLEQCKSKPPSFAELFLLLQTEEDKQTNKASRMKQHLGLTKPRAMSNMQAAHTSCTKDIGMLKEIEDAFVAITNDKEADC